MLEPVVEPVITPPPEAAHAYVYPVPVVAVSVVLGVLQKEVVPVMLTVAGNALTAAIRLLVKVQVALAENAAVNALVAPLAFKRTPVKV